MSHRGSGSTRYSGELVAREAENIVLLKGMATSIGQYPPVFLPGESPLPAREAWQATVYKVTESQTGLKRPGAHRRKTFLPVAPLPQ